MSLCMHAWAQHYGVHTHSICIKSGFETLLNTARHTPVWLSRTKAMSWRTPIHSITVARPCAPSCASQWFVKAGTMNGPAHTRDDMHGYIASRVGYILLIGSLCTHMHPCMVSCNMQYGAHAVCYHAACNMGPMQYDMHIGAMPSAVAAGPKGLTCVRHCHLLEARSASCQFERGRCQC
jgi:hypothetical protein